MYSLDLPSRKLEAFLSGAATPAPEVTVVYHDVFPNTKNDLREYPRANNFAYLDGTTEVTILPAPPQGTFRHIDNITIFNADNASVTVTIVIDDAGTNRTLVGSRTLTTLQTLVYDAGPNGTGSWQIF